MARQPSIMNHNFSQIPRAQIPRSSFDRSRSHKTAIDSGYLYPIFIDEALPGDTFNVQLTGFGRLATPLRPFMDNIIANTFFFFVPNRLVWANWQKFMGEQDNPGDSTDYLVPHIFSPGGTGYAENSIFDFFAIPTKVPDLGHSALPFRAYNLIWNTWFRDQNLQQSVRVNLGDEGTDALADFNLLRRGKRHDYFTSALPWPQKGPAVDLPLGTRAPVIGIGNTANTYTGPVSVYETDAATMRSYAAASALGPDVSTWFVEQGNSGRPGIYADLSEASAATINQLRQAFQVQKLRERDARGGTRYTEIVRAHFNVVSPDARLQRPEYLGGGSGFVNLHQIAQTSGSPQPTDGYTSTPQGSLSAYGTAGLANNGFTHSFTEHGIIIGLISIRADLNYQQGINKMWLRKTKYDFYWPALSMIGEQAILNKEIYAQGYNAVGNPDDAVFGYQERFAEYRYAPSVVTGEMRSNATQPLDTWHLAQDFATLPLLNAAFIEDNPPIERVLAVPTEREFIWDLYFKVRCARPMPVYGVPGMIDHF